MKYRTMTTSTAISYCANIHPCPHCNRLTNLYFMSFDKTKIFACSQECADIIADKKHK